MASTPQQFYNKPNPGELDTIFRAIALDLWVAGTAHRQHDTQPSLIAGSPTTEEMPIMRTPRLTRSRRNGESGQAFVEFALVLPILLLLLLGVIQFGNVFRDYIALTDATRVGARQAAVSRSIQPDANRIPLVITRSAEGRSQPQHGQMTVTVTPVKVDGITPGWEESGDVTVRATYPFRINLFGMVLYDGLLQSRTVERVE